MNQLKKIFIYLSEIIRLPVVDSNSKKVIGYTADVVATLREMYPRINALIVRKKMSSEKFYLAWNSVRELVENKAIFVSGLPGTPENKFSLSENEILLRETFWDKQIVDISGSKVVRVNDLHLLKENSNLWVAHMDVGFKGFLRRLGWLRLVEFVSRWLFSYEMKDKFISWKYVQPITTSDKSLCLKIPHSKLAELHPADLADILLDLGTDERITIFAALDDSTAAKTFLELPLKIRLQIASALNYERFAHIINEMPMDEVTDLLPNFPKKTINLLFKLLPHEKVVQIKDLMGHSEHVAGSLMNIEFITVRHNLTAGDILNKIKTEHRKVESIYYLFVVDDSDSLIGVLTLKHLLLADPNTPVSQLMRKRVVKVRVDTDIKEVARVFYKYNFYIVPVTDKQNKIKGIITMKDALESIFPEMKEESEEKQ